MATEIIKLIEEFASKNAQLEKMNTQLGQKGKDGHEFRQKLAQSRESCKTLSKRVAQQLKECAAREDKRVIAKLKTQFESELEKFRQVTKSLEQREREILVALSTDGKEKSPLAASNDSQMSSQQQMEFAQLEVDKIREKQEAILQIERDVSQLNEMFHDLNYLVQEQQVGIDVIENNISNAKQETNAGQAELVEAQEYQKSNRTCYCWIAFILLLIAAGITVYFTVFYKKQQ